MLPDHQLAENLTLVFVFFEGQEKDKSKLVTKFVGIKNLKKKTLRPLFMDEVQLPQG